jgi:hypothetical protein
MTITSAFHILHPAISYVHGNIYSAPHIIIIIIIIIITIKLYLHF